MPKKRAENNLTSVIGGKQEKGIFIVDRRVGEKVFILSLTRF
jgi:hypothetical protein